MINIDEIRKKMTREEFINEGSCPSDYGLINRFDECSSISYNNCCKCRERAIKDIKFKDDDIELERKLMQETLKEAMNIGIKKYAGWEITKMMAKKQLKDGIKVVWHNNSTDKQTVFIMYNHFLTYEESKDAIEIFYLTHDLNIGYFTIEEYMTFNEARKLGTPKHKDKGYSYRDCKASEFINEIDKKVWCVE